MNVHFEGDSTNGWVCELPFPDEYHPSAVFRGAKGTDMDEAYGNLLDALVFEVVELREIVGLAGA